MQSDRAILSLLGSYVFIHFLLTQPDLNPTLRTLLQTVENKELTKLFALLPA
jgi:hypothetical protein